MTRPVPDNAEALFEEARQRARRRRHRIAACVVALLGIAAVLVALAADGNGDHPTRPATTSPPVAGYHWTGGYDGQFSPDAAQLALPITDTASAGRADALALVDLASGTARVIPGSHALEPIYRAMTWSTTGHRLFFTTKTGSVRAYTPSAARSTTIAQLPSDARAMQIVAVARSD